MIAMSRSIKRSRSCDVGHIFSDGGEEAVFWQATRRNRAQIVADEAARYKKLLTGRVNVSWSSRKGCRGAFGRQPARKSVFHSEFSQSGVVDMADLAKHVCRVGTARIDYQGRVGQRVLNTTVKSGMGLGAVFAPTWKMVMASKQDEITWDEYRSLMWNMNRCQEGGNPCSS